MHTLIHNHKGSAEERITLISLLDGEDKRMVSQFIIQSMANRSPQEALLLD